MPFGPDILQKIKAKIDSIPDGWNKSDLELVVALNNKEIPNPIPQPQVPRRLEWYLRQAILDLVTDTNVRARIKAIFDFAEAILNNDKPGAATALTAMVNAGVITVAQRTALINWAQQNVPDDAWQPLISWANENISDVARIDYGDIQGARKI